MQTPTDNQLIENIRNGDEKSFALVFNLYAGNLVRYATTIVKNREDAEDIVQHIFASVWDKRGLPDINTSIKSYLYRSVFNSSLNKLKQIKVREEYATQVNYGSTETAASATEILEQKETSSLIEKAMDELPEQCKLVFKMSRLEQLKYQEIADQLGISIKTVENQMGKALKHMRVRLKEYTLLLIILDLF